MFQPKTTISPSVITSRGAQREMERIKMVHSDLLVGMANQSMKRDALGQQKTAELQGQQTIQVEMDKSRMVADTAAQKNAQDFALKQAELDIKKQALALQD